LFDVEAMNAHKMARRFRPKAFSDLSPARNQARFALRFAVNGLDPSQTKGWHVDG
jgi:hypothetical protein